MTDTPQMPPPMAVLQMATAKLITKPLYVAAELKVADQLTEGPKTVEQIAEAVGAHGESLYRILRALASVGVFTETAPRTFGLTPMAECLVDREGSVRDMVRWFSQPVHDAAWGEILHTVRTGTPAFDKAHGTTTFQWLGEHPNIAQIFHGAMTTNTVTFHAAIVDAFEREGTTTIYDIGGSNGHLVGQLLQKYPELTGGVFDRPDVTPGAEAYIREHGLDERCRIDAGDLFEAIPEGADTHILSFILHDWNDEECVRILQTCHKALPPGGRLLICENVVPPGNEPSFGKLIDIEMLVMLTGRERTEAEFQDLFTRAGFSHRRTVPTASPMSIIEATRD